MDRWLYGERLVLFPARSPTYPNNSLEDVMRHEVAHALIWRTSGGRPIPRWFNEGVAMAAVRERGVEDQTQLFYQLVTGSRTSLDELDRLFEGGQSDQVRAYALAGALVHDVFERHGAAGCAQILTRVGRGAPFEAAFADVAGITPAAAESEFLAASANLDKLAASHHLDNDRLDGRDPACHPCDLPAAKAESRNRETMGEGRTCRR